MKSSVLITALICITLLEAWAIFNGIDGILLTLVIGAICAVVGVIIPKPEILK